VVAVTLVGVVGGSELRSAGSAGSEGSPDPIAAVYFSPNGGATLAVVEAIGRARRQVLVSAYSFTSAPIAKALVEARRRGVVVEVVLDRREASKQYSSADFLVHMGVRTYIDSAHLSAHNKVIVIDDQVIVTGSFNFTNAAERQNAENLLVLRNEGLATRYADNWRHHAAHSVPYAGR
jgi:phosphatidylserine/phosphatidylglycerophosphate/cardiolipin synthase-like enzyme